MRYSIATAAAGVAVIGLASFAATRDTVSPANDAVIVVPSSKTTTAPFDPNPLSAGGALAHVAPSTVHAEAAADAPARLMAKSGAWWRPAVSDTWQWQLTGTIKTTYDADIYDLDLFATKDSTFNALHAQGRKVMCYFSAGSSEDWRDDYKDFAEADKGAALDGWAGERWVDVMSQGVRRIMLARLDLAAARGCDGVEPDNVDGYANRNGLGLTADNQLDYNRFLATEAHRRGLAIALKNDLDQIPALVASFDLAVNEQCNQYTECDALQPFVAAGKPVLNAEYQAKYRKNTNGARDKLCRATKAANIRTLVLPLKLDGTYRYACDE